MDGTAPRSPRRCRAAARSAAARSAAARTAAARSAASTRSAPDAILDEIGGLVQEGIVRRLWIFLIESDGRLRREVQQVDGTPVSPDVHAVPVLRGILRHLVRTEQEVVVVIERPAGPDPNPDDWAWHDAARAAARSTPVRLRAVLLAHRSGVVEMQPRTLAA